MFSVSLEGADAVVKNLDAVINKIHSLQTYMPREYADWRTDDMNSRYPDAHVSRRGRTLRLSQRIYNRGRGSAAKHPRPKKQRRRRGYSRRPVLRSGLFLALKTRMVDLLRETVQWR
jgi:hypothetical protein